MDPTDNLALVSLLVRGAGVWMRNSSYPEMVETTSLMLLDGNPDVRAALQNQFGFDAPAVLKACHHLQEAGLNRRLNAMGDAMHDAMVKGHADNRLMELARTSLMSMFEPDADQVTVAVDDIVAHTGITVERVRVVVERFRLDVPSHELVPRGQAWRA